MSYFLGYYVIGFLLVITIEWLMPDSKENKVNAFSGPDCFMLFFVILFWLPLAFIFIQALIFNFLTPRGN